MRGPVRKISMEVAVTDAGEATSESAPPKAKESTPRQWEIRAALRALSRSREDSKRRSPADDLIDAAWSLVAAKSEFTVKEVAERADVAIQTFYRHFGTKDELLFAMLEEGINQGIAGLLAKAAAFEDPVECLHSLVIGPILGPYDEAGIRNLQWRARERQRLWERFPEAVEAVYEPYRSALITAIEAARAKGLASSDDPALDGNLIQHLVLTMTHVVHTGGMHETPEVVAESVWRMCWQGLSPRRS